MTDRAADDRPRAFATKGAPQIRIFRLGNVLGMISLMRREALREYRWFGMAVVGPAIQAILFAAVFTLAAGDALARTGVDFMAFIGAGLVISAVMQRGLETTGYSLMFDKLESDGLNDVLSAPLNTLEILTAYLVNGIVVSLIIGIGIWLCLFLFGLGLPQHPLATLFFMALAAGIFSLGGIIGAVFSAKWDSFAGKETFIVAPVLFLSGTFFPITAVPDGLWRTIFQANPIYYLVDGFRWAALGYGDTDPLTSAGIGLVVFAIVLAVAARLLSTGYRIKP
ncbi:ABC transporter permease [Rhodospirillaceae bacterium KN72]|uniref:Transport permease protein n=1 Tax=Pacificispira spongiicola TaxID=2729598 RepID=A0A7Y0E071_9PROT|nr:ABC transporter permease [Pacificispira spongiicola]NMM44830.1 ABC transporter permease [Pacificispira spongiicola]